MMKTHAIKEVWRTSSMLEDVAKNFDSRAEDHYFVPHMRSTGALRHGKTVWLRRGLEGEWENTDRFLTVHMYLLGFMMDRRQSCNGVRAGRTYIHRLKPGQHIDKHSDFAETYFLFVERYQVYLNKPPGMKIVHDGPDIQAGQLIRFNQFADHEYVNDSDQDFYMLVFDVEAK
jgi:hypothetical protein